MGSAVSQSLVDINELEKQLVKNLKQVCDNHGRETDISKSAPILHKLGKIYHFRGKQGHDPICFIQSTGLYNAAVVRLPKEKQKQVEQDLKCLCNDIVKSTNTNKTQNVNLIKKGNKVKKQFQILRESVNMKLKSIPQIRESTAKKHLKKLEQSKVKIVKSLQVHITQRYTQIMADLAKYCCDIMGKPPCKFTVIGMGSLARKEITPYSDFEHIIVLENSILNKTSEEKEFILNYFRWFSLIMHIVVINMKETIICSVAIPTLNDYYHGKKEDDWFYDVFTPQGISFDYMMPHASHFPLGRQPTPRKPWKAELIKPVTEMLHYLTKESKLKEGYN